MSDKTLGNARGLNSIADPRQFKGSPGRAKRNKRATEDQPPEPVEARRPTEDPIADDLARPEQTESAARPTQRSAPASTKARPAPIATAPHRAVQPGVQRKRRELSIPHRVAEALEATGINAADVVMAGYRNHADAIYAGTGGRTAAKGRTRLRVSISDAEFEQITRLGLARGWNRSETVSVILAIELGIEPAMSNDGAD